MLQMSIREGFGLAATEALWKGTPVVATGVGGLETQVRDGENGFLIEPGNYGEAADRVTSLLLEDERRKERRRKARETVRNEFLITLLMKDWMDLWRELLL